MGMKVVMCAKEYWKTQLTTITVLLPARCRHSQASRTARNCLLLLSGRRRREEVKAGTSRKRKGVPHRAPLQLIVGLYALVL
ncbi:unnamed protein product [Ilex paraguariensis]|uniref:Uncharacterized protein n=1 Tax=Ilex paraguariensis TaxID=185542 RepID=A0ABC8SFS5_9AQUA